MNAPIFLHPLRGLLQTALGRLWGGLDQHQRPAAGLH
jgi:hypothetical protein